MCWGIGGMPRYLRTLGRRRMSVWTDMNAEVVRRYTSTPYQNISETTTLSQHNVAYRRELRHEEQTKDTQPAEKVDHMSRIGICGGHIFHG